MKLWLKPTTFCCSGTSVQQLDQICGRRRFAQGLPGGCQHSESIAYSFGQRGDSVGGLFQVRGHDGPLDGAQRLLLNHVQQGTRICTHKWLLVQKQTNKLHRKPKNPPREGSSLFGFFQLMVIVFPVMVSITGGPSGASGTMSVEIVKSNDEIVKNRTNK